MSEKLVTKSYTVGRLLCSPIREFLKEVQFSGKNITFIEGSGWFQRKFTIKGSPQDVRLVNSSILKWMRDNDIGRS